MRKLRNQVENERGDNLRIEDLDEDYKCEGQMELPIEYEPIWDIDYDMQTDSIFEVPTCPVCNADKQLVPYMIDFNCGHCGNCGAKINLNGEKIKKYIEENFGEKTEEEKCFKCGGVMKIHYYKHMGEWRTGGGACEACGMRFIV